MANLSGNGKPNDAEWLQAAISEALKAADVGEVPIGAVAVVDDRMVARAHNVRESTGNPLGHAEVLLIQQMILHVTPGLTRGPALLDAGSEAGMTKVNWRLTDVTIYVTCEPCLMCMGAMLQARIPRVVYGCKDPKAGACGSLYDVSNDARLNHRMEVTTGVLGEECGKLLSDFFRAIRK
jgi:tRNA(adenine34) deaminase